MKWHALILSLLALTLINIASLDWSKLGFVTKKDYRLDRTQQKLSRTFVTPILKDKTTLCIDIVADSQIQVFLSSIIFNGIHPKEHSFLEMQNKRVDIKWSENQVQFISKIELNILKPLKKSSSRMCFNNVEINLENISIDQVVITDQSGKEIKQYFNNISPLLYQENVSSELKVPKSFKVIRDSIYISNSHHFINEDVFIPASFKKLIVAAGAKLTFSANVSLLSYATLEAIGKKNRPIIIEGNDRAPFAILNAKNKSTLKFVNVSGGTQSHINGIPFSCSFCFYHNNVSIENSSFNHSKAEDALNIKKSEVHIENVELSDNSSDGFDCDYCQLNLNNAFFRKNKGDGLDISHTQFNVKNVLFENNLDKGFSVGENSNGYLENAKGIHNNIDIALKDSSYLKTKNINAKIESYIKKNYFSAPTLVQE